MSYSYGGPGAFDPYAQYGGGAGNGGGYGNVPGGPLGLGYGNGYGNAGGVPFGVPQPIAYDAAGEEIRTIFVTGFPADVKERELNNMLRFLPGYVASQMNFKSGQAHGFALFDSGPAAQAANSLVAQIQFDETSILRCELARKNMFVKEDPSTKRNRFGFGGAPATYSITTAPPPNADPIVPIQPAGFAPVTNLGDNPPCSTLFVGNLGDTVNEQELRGLFGPQPGFRQMKLVRGAKATTCFVEYADVASAMTVHQQLQGAVLPSSDRGGLRIQYSKNPFGKRRE